MHNNLILLKLKALVSRRLVSLSSWVERNCQNKLTSSSTLSMLSSSSLPSSSASSSSSSSSSSSTRRCKSRWFRLSIFLFVGSKVMDSSQSLSSQDRKKNKSNALPSSSTPSLSPSLPHPPSFSSSFVNR